jgi:glycosyltransferase involved in cell wall biosynthesis
MTQTHVNVLHVIDTLEIGGAERVAVNLVNNLPRDRFKPHLCTTRGEGPLSRDVKSDVRRLQLLRKRRFDLFAIHKLVKYIRKNDIQIVHAHGSALFVAIAATVSTPKTKLIWHDHYGVIESAERPAWIYRLAAKNVTAVISVNTTLAVWARVRLGVDANRVWQLNNFALPTQATTLPLLPGSSDLRVVCVANLRPEKGHRDLIEAVARVRESLPGVHLLLVGAAPNPVYLGLLNEDIRRLELGSTVSFLGPRDDVQAILQQCSVGVLSSHHEGLPIALLEYGLAGLAVVSTDSGNCAEVLDAGRCGILVGTRQPTMLASAIQRLLSDPNLRSDLATSFRQRVETYYSATEAISRLSDIYEIAVNGETAGNRVRVPALAAYEPRRNPRDKAFQAV